MSSYYFFSKYYDILTQNISYKERADYFDRLIERHGGVKNILLDLACGTGSLSEEMSRRGYDVIGVDNSAEMLNVAMDKKLESGLDILYICQNMTELDLFGTVDVIICALDSLNHLPDINSVKKAIQKAALFCEQDGLFIFDVNMPYKHKNILGNNTYIYETDFVYCIWQNTYNNINNDNRVDISLDFFEKQDNGLYKRYEEEFSEIAFDTCILDNILNEAGFDVLEHYNYDTFDAPQSDSEKIVYVARKVR
jgi:SAM-dependent methyltransferase